MSAPEYSDGDNLFGVDMDNIVEALAKNGVLTGWTLAENSTPNMSVDVAAGTGFIGGLYKTTGSTTNVVITASDPDDPRLDIIVINSSGTISAIAGVAAVEPNPPDLPDDNICLAIIEVAATVTTILDANIVSKRFLLGSIKNEMIDYTENRTFQGTVNFQDTLKLESAKRLGFCFSGGTVVGELYADSTTGLRITANLTLGSALTFKLGDGSDILAQLQALSGVFYIRDKDSNVRYQHANNGDTHIKAPSGNIYINPSGKLYLQDDVVFEGQMQASGAILSLVSNSSAAVQLEFETTSSVGGPAPEDHETGSSGTPGAQAWAVSAAEVAYDTDGSLSAYSERADLEDLRAIKELRHPDTGEKVRSSWGDPLFDAGTIPHYIKGKHCFEKHTITTYDPITDKKIKQTINRPDRGYISSNKWKGWMISLHQKHDERASTQDEEMNLMKAEILGLKEQLKAIGV